MQNYWHHPNIEPIIFHIPYTPLAIRWYSVLYVGGFLVGRALLRRLTKEKRFKLTKDTVEQFILWALVSAVVGARVVYCLVYDLPTFLSNPLYLFQVYRGGLSFHGSLIGIIIAVILFAKKTKNRFWNFADAVAFATPPGLAMGRLGNFINGELHGRVSTVPWAMIFKDGGPDPRHPSQLYECFLEGILLMLVLWLVKRKARWEGAIAVSFLVGYSVCRFIAEFFREPDAQLGYLWAGATMGQILSILMFAISATVGYMVYRNAPRFGRG